MSNGRERLGFLAVSGLALLAVAFMPPAASPALARLTGPLDPLLAVAVAALLGIWSIDRLRATTSPVLWWRLALLGAAFGLAPIAIDLSVPFPRDLNVLVPAALLYYPAAGFLAEVAFHLLPLAAMAVLLRRLDPPLWAYAPAVVAEPAFQVALGAGPPLQSALVATHVAAFSAAQLWVFRRHGFLAMYAMRMAFYLVWHILWGTARLPLLFA